jgi:hypothetical protein
MSVEGSTTSTSLACFEIENEGLAEAKVLKIQLSEQQQDFEILDGLARDRDTSPAESVGSSLNAKASEKCSAGESAGSKADGHEANQNTCTDEYEGSFDNRSVVNSPILQHRTKRGSGNDESDEDEEAEDSNEDVIVQSAKADEVMETGAESTNPLHAGMISIIIEMDDEETKIEEYESPKDLNQEELNEEELDEEAMETVQITLVTVDGAVELPTSTTNDSTEAATTNLPAVSTDAEMLPEVTADSVTTAAGDNGSVEFEPGYGHDDDTTSDGWRRVVCSPRRRRPSEVLEEYFILVGRPQKIQNIRWILGEHGYETRIHSTLPIFRCRFFRW